MKLSFVVGFSAVLALSGLGCGIEHEGEFAEGQQPQVAVGLRDYRHYTFTFANNEPLMEVFAMVNTVGDFKAANEYWYVTTDSLQYLGTEDLEITHDDDDGTPAPGSGDQEFTLPLYPTWNSFSSDPVGGGYRYDSGSRHLRLAVNSGLIVRLTWYQTIPSAGTPANITPDADAFVGSGSVTVPSGQAGYYIDATID